MTTVEIVARVQMMVDQVRFKGITSDLVVYIPTSINLYQPHPAHPPNGTLYERLLSLTGIVDVRPTEQEHFYLTWDPAELEELP